jgi:ribonuclease HI
MISMKNFGITMEYNHEPHYLSGVEVTELSHRQDWFNRLSHTGKLYEDPNHLVRRSDIDQKRATEKVTICTDGSTLPGSDRASGIGLFWIRSRSGEQKIHEMRGSAKTSGNNFFAEVAAILVGLINTPINTSITFHTDSTAAVAAIEKKHLSERRAIRSAARPLIRSVQRIIQIRNEQNAYTELRWVRAHSGKTDIISLGNQRADHLANRGREEAKDMDAWPDYLYNEEQVVLRINESHVIGDVRNEVKRTIAEQTLDKWKQMRTQGEAIRDAGATLYSVHQLFKLLRTFKLKLEAEAVALTICRRWPTKKLKQKLNITIGAVRCYFCKFGEDDIEHILSCRDVNKMRAPAALLDSVYEELDPTGYWRRLMAQEIDNACAVINKKASKLMKGRKEELQILVHLMLENPDPKTAFERARILEAEHYAETREQEDSLNILRATLIPNWFDPNRQPRAALGWNLLWNQTKKYRETLKRLSNTDMVAGSSGIIPNDARKIVEVMIQLERPA